MNKYQRELAKKYVTEQLWQTTEYCVRPDWSTSGESLWTILNRFQWLNRLPSAMVLEILSRNQGNQSASVSFDLRVRVPPALNALPTDFGVEPPILAASIFEISDRRVARAISSSHLRFCEQCLLNGFHATVHQCSLLTTCPIHRTRLRSRCPICAQRIPYRFDHASAPYPFACPRCAGSLASVLDSDRGRPLRINVDDCRVLETVQRTIERHVQVKTVANLNFGDSPAVRASGLRNRLKYLKPLIARCLTYNIHLPSQRTTIRVARSLQQTLPNTTISAATEPTRKGWHGYSTQFLRLEARYHHILTALNERSLTESRHSNTGEHQLLERATTIFRLTWEGVCDPKYLNQHDHPAFGIGVWLSLVQMRYGRTRRPANELLVAFDDAMTVTLATAIRWAWLLNITKIKADPPRLLLPEIFDSARSQRFEKRNS